MTTDLFDVPAGDFELNAGVWGAHASPRDGGPVIDTVEQRANKSSGTDYDSFDADMSQMGLLNTALNALPGDLMGNSRDFLAAPAAGGGGGGGGSFLDSALDAALGSFGSFGSFDRPDPGFQSRMWTGDQGNMWETSLARGAFNDSFSDEGIWEGIEGVKTHQAVLDEQAKALARGGQGLWNRAVHGDAFWGYKDSVSGDISYESYEDALYVSQRMAHWNAQAAASPFRAFLSQNRPGTGFSMEEGIWEGIDGVMTHGDVMSQSLTDRLLSRIF